MTSTLISPAAIRPRIKVNGAPLKADHADAITELRIERRLRQPARATLRFSDPTFDISSSGHLSLGTKLVVAVSDDGTLFEGEVTGFELRQGSAPVSDRYAQDYVVEAHDWSHRLAGATHIETYLNMTIADVVTKIVSRAGYSASASATTEVFPVVMQAENDLSFLNTLADRVGYDWYVDGQSLVFAPAGAGSQTKVSLHRELSAFRVRARVTGVPRKVEARSWDASTHKPIVAQKETQSVPLQPDATFVDELMKKAAHFGSTATAYATARGGATDGEVAKLAQSIADTLVHEGVTAEGTVIGATALAPGGTVKVEDAGPGSGSYHVTEVVTTFRQATGMRSDFVAGPRRPRTLVDSLARPSLTSFRHTGPLIGVVTSILDPDKYGRVKVKLPTLGETIETDWARLAAAGAGQGRGVLFLPEVGDEVLVVFENGDTARPIVVGALWHKEAAPDYDPDSWNGEVKVRQIVSRKGHYVRIGDSDTPADSFVEVGLADKKTKVRLGDDKKVLVNAPAGTELTIQCGDQSSIKFDGNGGITISATKITLTATDALAMSANDKLTGSAPQLSLSGEGKAELKSSGQVSVQAEGMLQLSANGMVQIN